MQTIDRTFAVLRALASRNETSTLSEVSRAADLPKSTTSRILAALENLGMVDRAGGQYSIGSGLATLTHTATPVGALRELSRPYLADLADRLGENASLAVADGDASGTRPGARVGAVGARKGGSRRPGTERGRGAEPSRRIGTGRGANRAGRALPRAAGSGGPRARSGA